MEGFQDDCYLFLILSNKEFTVEKNVLSGYQKESDPPTTAVFFSEGLEIKSPK